jgi:hypothetical protein
VLTNTMIAQLSDRVHAGGCWYAARNNMMPLRWLWDKAVATALKSDGHTHYCVVGQVRHEAIRRRVRTVSHSEQ